MGCHNGLEETSTKRVFLLPWLHKVKSDDFEKTAREEANRATESLRYSLVHHNEAKNEAIERIKKIFLEQFEELSDSLKRLKTESNCIEEFLDYLKGMLKYLK